MSTLAAVQLLDVKFDVMVEPCSGQVCDDIFRGL